MQLVEQSSTERPLVFVMFDETDHVTPKTGLFPTVQLSKNGGVFSAPSGVVTEIGSTGFYQVAGNATDTNTLGVLVLSATATGADPVSEAYLVTNDDLSAARATAANQASILASQITAQNDLDTLTGSDGVTLATAQGNYAPSKAGDAMALTSGERTTVASSVWASGTRTLTSFGTLVADIWASVTDSSGITTLLSRIGSALNISSGKVEANVVEVNGSAATPNTALATALEEIKGSGFLEATDSLEAIRNRGDAAWADSSLDAAAVRAAIGMAAADLDTQLTAIASSAGLDAAGVRTAIGLAVANLDTQLSALSNLDVAVSTRAEAVSGGSGANTITITVDDGTDPLENAKVRLTEGVNSYLGVTDASGEVVFSVDDATYAVAVTKPGYSFTPTTLAVSATASQTYSMSAIAIAAPADPEMCRVYAYMAELDGTTNRAPSVTFTLQGPTKTTKVLEITKISATFVSGYLEVDLQRTDAMTPSGRTYQVRCDALGLNTSMSLAASTFNLADLI
jgi:hypothetical protein